MSIDIQNDTRTRQRQRKHDNIDYCETVDFKSITGVVFILDILVFTTLLAVGLLYFGTTGYQYCNFQAAIFLVLSGFGNLLLSTLRTFANSSLFVIQGAFNVNMFIYSTIIIYPHFPQWRQIASGGYNIKDDTPHSCHPMLFAFAATWTMILTIWVGAAFVAIFFVCLESCFVGCQRNVQEPSDLGRFFFLRVKERESESTALCTINYNC